MDAQNLKINDQNDKDKIAEQILKALKSIRYGYVQITVQDSKVVQIDKVEKFRLNHALSFYT